MIDSVSERFSNNKEKSIVESPAWFNEYVSDLKENNVDFLDEVNTISSLSLDEIEERIGGELSELPYEYLQTLFIDGTDVLEVASFLREKREKYLLNHPELQLSKGYSEGVISNDGRFISKEEWESASDSEKRAIMVGSTCFHYNSGTPGMDSNPDDRW